MQDDLQQPDINISDIDTAPSSTEVTATDTVVKIDDYKEAFARATERNAQLEEELDAAKKKARSVEILDNLIEPSAKKAFNFMFVYSGAVGLMLLMNSFGCFKIPMEEGVLQVLVGSTAVTVIGLVGMVLTGIFVGARK